MKIHIAAVFHAVLCSLVLSLGAAPAGSQAQTIGLVDIGKAINHIQTDAATVQVGATAALGYVAPYAFFAQVSGSNINLLSPPSISGPTSAVVNNSVYYNHGILGLNPFTGDWMIGSGAAIPNNWPNATLGELDANFANGTYTMQVGGNSVALALTGDAYPNTPFLTVTGGTWSGGSYVIDVSKPLGITSNTFTNYGGNAGGYVFGGVLGVSTVQTFSFNSPASNALQFSLPAFSLEAGKSYTAMGRFGTNVDFKLVDNAPYVAEYNSFTTFTVVAVPEPQTYAMLSAGLLLLGSIATRRRKTSRAGAARAQA